MSFINVKQTNLIHFKGTLFTSIINLKVTYLKGQCHEIFCFRFFHESPSPKLLIITLGSFRIFSKIRGDIRKSRCTTSVNDTGGKLPPVSTTPAANLPAVSTTLAANFATSSLCVVDTCGKKWEQYQAADT